MVREEVFTNSISDEGVICWMYKGTLQLNKKEVNPLKKWAKDLNWHFSQGDIQKANKQRKRCSTSLIIREMQIKITVRSHITPIRLLSKKKKNWTNKPPENNQCWWGCGEMEPLGTVSGNVKWHSYCGKVYKCMVTPQKVKHRIVIWCSNSTSQGRYPKELKAEIQRDFCIPVPIVTFFTIASEKWKWKSCPTLCDPMDCSPWNSPGQNTGVGSLSLLQGIFPTQVSSPDLTDLLHCRQTLYQLSYQGSPQ